MSLTKPQERKLQRLIDATAKTGSLYYSAQQALNEYAIYLYGFEPGDVDADGIIDALFGGCGRPSGMEAYDFDQEMQKSL